MKLCLHTVSEGYHFPNYAVRLAKGINFLLYAQKWCSHILDGKMGNTVQNVSCSQLLLQTGTLWMIFCYRLVIVIVGQSA